MKQSLLYLLVIVACSCNTAAPGNATKDSTVATAVAINYPYAIEHPDNWEMGSTANTMVALKALKAWEEGKMEEALQYFGDSIHVRFDGIDKKMSNDSLKAFFTDGWNSYKTVTEKMHDWESVVSKDKSEEWVTLWYTQTWETKAGLKDSSAVINDIKLKDGKIIGLDEYNRKFH